MHRQGTGLRHRLDLLAYFVAGIALILAGASPSTAKDDPITLHVFGPELPFMFPVSGGQKDFAWSKLIASGDVGIGTISRGAGEVIGFDGAFYIAVPEHPTPRPVTDEMTPTGVAITFTPQHTLTIDKAVSLADFQSALDREFVDTETFVYVFKATATLASVEYQLAGPRPSKDVLDGIRSGESQKAVTIGTPKYTAKNLAVTLVGLRAPAYLNTVFEIPYHMHFLADDKSILGHISRMEASNIQVEWARTQALNIRYWDAD